LFTRRQFQLFQGKIVRKKDCEKAIVAQILKSKLLLIKLKILPRRK
jgi:hypothetical protein